MPKRQLSERSVLPLKGTTTQIFLSHTHTHHHKSCVVVAKNTSKYMLKSWSFHSWRSVQPVDSNSSNANLVCFLTILFVMTQNMENTDLDTNFCSSDWFNDEEKLPWWGHVAKCMLKVNKIPKHIAFVMDGNRRYARKCHLHSVIQGHSRGFDQMTKVLEWCRDMGVQEVTVYAFSIENFKRDEQEVSELMKMAEQKFERLFANRSKLEEKQICFRFFGDLKMLSNKIQRLVAEIEQLTKEYNKGFVNVCLAYTSQNEISRAMEWIRRGTQLGFLQESDIDEKLIADCLDTRHSNHVDMLIRTSGEKRLSDFLLYQCSNCYVHFEDVLWPELSFWHLFKAILHYQHSLGFTEKLADNSLLDTSLDTKAASDNSKFLEWMEEERLNERNKLLIDS